MLFTHEVKLDPIVVKPEPIAEMLEQVTEYAVADQADRRDADQYRPSIEEPRDRHQSRDQANLNRRDGLDPHQ